MRKKTVIYIAFFFLNLIIPTLVFAQNIEFSQEEQKFIKYNPVLKVQVDAHLHPISFLDHDGQYKGIVIDYLDKMAEKLNVEFEYFDPNLDKVGKAYYVDVLTTFSASRYDSRNWLVSDPYVKFPYLLYSYKDKTPVLNIESIAHKTLAVIRNHDIAGVLNREHSHQNFYLAKDIEDAIKALENSQADYFIGDILTIKHYMDAHQTVDLTIVGKTDYFYEAQLAVHAGQRKLLNLLNKAASHVSAQELNFIVDKWTQESIKKVLDIALLMRIMSVVIIIVLLFWYYNNRLRRMVDLRTTELLRANELLEESKEHYKELYEEAASIADEKQKMEEQLYHSQKMDAIGKLAGGVAHDFNNILAVIFAQVHLIKLDINKKREITGRLVELEAAGNRAARLIEQLLLFSRKEEHDFKYYELNIILENLLKMVTRLLGENIDYKFIAGKLQGTVLADSGQIDQVITNLCINARDAMPNGGTLIITTSSVDLRHIPKTKLIDANPGMYNLITVRDTGTGITPEFKSRIFEPFFTTKDVGKGTGLGLATVYSIVKAHEGFINVESELGAGTCFEIYLPVKDKKEDDIEEKEEDKVVRGKGQTILLAEDDDNLRELVYEFLVEYGYKVILAVDGNQALEHYQHYKDAIDILLLDVVMPNKSGSEVYEYLKEVGADVPVIFCSGYDFGKLKGLSTDEKEIIFIKKPYRINDLLNTISKVLQNR